MKWREFKAGGGGARGLAEGLLSPDKRLLHNKKNGKLQETDKSTTKVTECSFSQN